MDFAPYQSSPPESNRPFSPPTSPPATSPRTSLENNFRRFSPSVLHKPTPAASSPPLLHPQPQRNSTGIAGGWLGTAGSVSPFPDAAVHREGVSEFDTSLGIRLDYEACLAYLALPPLGGIFLLIAERKSDYVRFHAWQSSLLFTCMLVLHIIFSGSSLLTWFLFLADCVLAAALTVRAYQDADTLDRFEVPVIGQFASRFLDDE